jgi:hypothetical protein
LSYASNKQTIGDQSGSFPVLSVRLQDGHQKFQSFDLGGQVNAKISKLDIAE